MDEEPLSGLICQESETCLNTDQQQEVVNEEFYFDYINNNKYYSDIDDDEHMAMLVDREIGFGFKKGQALVFGNWVKCARLDAITWILKTRAVFGFHFQTVYLSMTYFDRFLSKRSIDSEKTWAIRLLSVACLSLAAKVEEINTPSLSEFQIEDYNFEGKSIQRMELLVLNTLDWRMFSITPFAFLHYFVMKFCKGSPPNLIVSKSLDLILATMREINLMKFRPSVIAAAATLVALDQRLTRKSLECLMMNSISNCGLLQLEDVFQCYSLMQKLEKKKILMPKSINPPDLSPTHLRQMDVLDNSSVSSAVSNKRTRLTFDNGDQGC